MDRRRFLQLGVATGAALSLPFGAAGCEEPQPPTAEEQAKGRCDLLAGDLGFSGTHAALFPTGRILYWSYDPADEDNVNTMLWREWHYQLHFAEAPTVARHNRNLFCAGHCFLPNGRLLIAAGQSRNYVPLPWENPQGADHDVHIFNPATKEWVRHAHMPGARWYPTATVLSDGVAIVVGGLASRYPVAADNDEYELFDWKDNTKTKPAHFNPGFGNLTYPFVKLLPDGSPRGTLFVHAQNETRLLDLNTMAWRGPFKTLTTGSRTYNTQGACVVLPIRASHPKDIRVLLVGGQLDEGTPSSELFPTCKPDEAELASNRAQIFEFRPDNPSSSRWRDPAGQPEFRRFMGDATLLPDGNVLLTSGAQRGKADCSFDAVFEAELFDSRTESWRTVARINHKRLYHSTAVLVPDGEVIIAGNTWHWNPDNPVEDGTLEAFRPPYSFAQTAKPWINTLYKREVTYSDLLKIIWSAVTLPRPEVERVVLMRPSSVTHTNNMDQRHIELEIAERGNDGGQDFVTVRLPANGTVAPPGFYMLFLVSNAGVPSWAEWIRLGSG